MRDLTSALSLVLVAGLTAPALGQQLFSTGDPILAVDTDTGNNSSYPDGESPFWVPDQDPTTKYLNFGKFGTGTIITPNYGASTIQSMRFTTANDAPERDPANWELYGTNDPVTSDDNSAGEEENWTLIASGDATLPDDRGAFGPVYDFANGSSYTAYKIVFPTVKNPGTANSMQIADISLFTGAGGGGDQVLELLDDAIAVGLEGSESSYPGLEGPANILDGDSNTKYLNFGQENCGFIISRADGAAVTVEQFTITTANDWPERDPTSWELYGTNDPVTSEDNSTGLEENWTLIDSGPIDLPLERFTVGPTVAVSNSTEYTGYKMLFPTIREASDWPGDSMQIADMLIEGAADDCVADWNGDGSVNTQDFIAYLNDWSAGNANADLNDDGNVNTQDFIAFLNAWSAGC